MELATIDFKIAPGNDIQRRIAALQLKNASVLREEQRWRMPGIAQGKRAGWSEIGAD